MVATGVNIRRLATVQPDFEAAFQRVLHWSAETDDQIEQRVASILADVRARGDAAVLEYTERATQGEVVGEHGAQRVHR